jgi:hypothetical protein
VLDGLSRGEKAGVQRLARALLLHDFLTLLEDALDRFARLGLWPAADQLKHLLQAFDMLLRLVGCVRNAFFSSSDRAAFAILGRYLRI